MTRHDTKDEIMLAGAPISGQGGISGELKKRLEQAQERLRLEREKTLRNSSLSQNIESAISSQKNALNRQGVTNVKAGDEMIDKLNGVETTWNRERSVLNDTIKTSEESSAMLKKANEKINTLELELYNSAVEKEKLYSEISDIKKALAQLETKEKRSIFQDNASRTGDSKTLQIFYTQISSLEQELKQKTYEVEHLEKELSQAKDGCELQIRKVYELTGELDKANSTLKNTDKIMQEYEALKQLDSMHAELDRSHEEEVAQLNQQLLKARQKADEIAQLNKANDTVASAKVARLEMELEAAKKNETAVEDLQRQLEEKQQALDALKNDFDILLADSVRSMEDSLREKEHEFALKSETYEAVSKDLEAEKNKAEAELAKLKPYLESLKAVNASLEREFKKVVGQIETLSKANREHMIKVELLSKNLDKATVDVRDKDQRICELSRQLSVTQEEHQHNEQALKRQHSKEREDLQDHFSRSEEELRQKQMAREEELKAQYTLSEKELIQKHLITEEELKAQYTRSEEELIQKHLFTEEELKQQHIKAQEELKRQFAQSEEALKKQYAEHEEDLKREHDKILAELNELSARNEEALKANFIDKIDALNAQLSVKEKEHSSILEDLNRNLEDEMQKSKLFADKLDEYVRQGESETHLKVSEYEALTKEQAEKLKQHEERVLTLQKQIEEQNFEYAAKVADLNGQIEKQTKEFENKLLEYNVEAHKQKQEVADLNSQLDKERSEFKQRLSELQALIDGQVAGHAAELGKLNETISQQQIKIDEQNKQLEERQVAIDKYQAEVGALSKQLLDRIEQIESISGQIDTYKLTSQEEKQLLGEKRSMLDEYGKLEAISKKLVDERNILENDVKTLFEHSQKLEGDKKSLAENLETLKKKIANDAVVIKTLSEQIIITQKNNEQLVKDMHAQKEIYQKRLNVAKQKYQELSHTAVTLAKAVNSQRKIYEENLEKLKTSSENAKLLLMQETAKSAELKGKIDAYEAKAKTFLDRVKWTITGK